MNVLALLDAENILGWLVSELVESAPLAVANGYPELAEGWAAGTVTAQVIEVPEEDAFCADLYRVVDGAVARIP